MFPWYIYCMVNLQYVDSVNLFYVFSWLDRYILIGNHRDAWTWGAIDPNSGTAVLLECMLIKEKKYSFDPLNLLSNVIIPHKSDSSFNEFKEIECMETETLDHIFELVCRRIRHNRIHWMGRGIIFYNKNTI